MSNNEKATFQVEAMSHDIFSTKFCNDGKVDPLATTDYKEPPIVAYMNEGFRTSEEVIGFDVYNMSVTGSVAKSLTSIATDSDHVPVVLCIKNECQPAATDANGHRRKQCAVHTGDQMSMKEIKVHSYAESSFAAYREMLPLIRYKGGTCGNGSEALILIEQQQQDDIVVINSSGNGIAATLDASYWKGAGARNGKEREFIAVLKV